MEERNAFRSRGAPPSRGGRDERRFYDFILSFFRVQSILYTHISIDELDDLLFQTLQLLKEYFASIDSESNKSGEVAKIIHICLCMIFIAHATITDASKQVIKKEKGPLSSCQLDPESEKGEQMLS